MPDDDQSLTLTSVAPDTMDGRRAIAAQEPGLKGAVHTPAESDIDALIEPLLRDALRELDGRAPRLAGMVRYHLGYVDSGMNDLPAGAVDRGKRVRPAVALLVTGAAGADPSRAAPVAAAIELLHNFTLIHDDIQDESQTRRHRPTVWTLWGIGQGINAGDALFAAAHMPLYTLPTRGVAPELALELLADFDRMTIDIVAGQTLDLSFESQHDVAPDEYLTMIEAKTAAIVRFAAWAGARIGGVAESVARQWAEFGLALGLGFQIRDDLLGTWGLPSETGKPHADDVRRRKKSLPILLLRQRLDPAARADLDRLYAEPQLDDSAIARVLTLLEEAAIRREVEAEIERFHERALRALLLVAPDPENPYRQRLDDLVRRLAVRTG